MRKKVTYIVSDIDKSLAFEWIAQRIDKDRFELQFILIQNVATSSLREFLENKGVVVHTLVCQSKRDWPGCWMSIYNILRRERPDVVHCHLLQACILGLSAARVAGVKARIYTRHHSSLHHVYFPKGVYWDKFANRMATQIVAISKPVVEILADWEKVPLSKIVSIPHGFDLEAFATADAEKLQSLRQKYNLMGASPVIGVISRFTEWKGVQFAVPAFQRIRAHFPNARMLLFNAKGDYASQIFALLETMEPQSYAAIPFESDIATAYHLFDLLLHLPVDPYSEAFGQVYIEAMASGVPIVATRSGIAVDILKDGENSLVVPYKDSEEVAKSAIRVLTDSELRQRIIQNARKTAEYYTIEMMMQKLEELYDRV